MNTSIALAGSLEVLGSRALVVLDQFGRFGLLAGRTLRLLGRNDKSFPSLHASNAFSAGQMTINNNIFVNPN